MSLTYAAISGAAAHISFKSCSSTLINGIAVALPQIDELQGRGRASIPNYPNGHAQHLYLKQLVSM